MSKTLTFHRTAGWYARWRKLKLLVNDVEIGRLSIRQRLTLPDIPSDGILTMGMDWSETDPFPLADVPDQAVVQITSPFRWNMNGWLGISSLPFEIKILE